MKRNALAALAALILGATLAAPLGAQAQDLPSYSRPQGADDLQIHGRIATFDGDYSLTVRDEKGYTDQVQMHQGTIINPTGLTLQPGMIVSILGYNAGDHFAANEIDTPYTFYNAVPYYAGHPWDYYGPAISLGFFFGNGGWWHGPYFGGPYGYYGGYRYYNDVNVRNVYRTYNGAGGFHGRAYVAPRSAGGYYRQGGGRAAGAPARAFTAPSGGNRHH